MAHYNSMPLYRDLSLVLSRPKSKPVYNILRHIFVGVNSKVAQKSGTENLNRFRIASVNTPYVGQNGHHGGAKRT